MAKFESVTGVFIPRIDEITESFSVQNRNEKKLISINVSAENISKLFIAITSEMVFPGFLVLEVGSHINVEKELRIEGTDGFHKDVFYMDGLNKEQFNSIYNMYEQYFVQDGMINFGFGSHISKEEIFVGPYKIFTIWANNVERYVQILLEMGFEQNDKLVTAWDLFSQANPGQKRTLEFNGKRIYDVVEELKVKGLYLAERRED